MVRAQNAKLELESAKAAESSNAHCLKLQNELAQIISAKEMDESRFRRSISKLEEQLKASTDDNSLLSASQQVIQEQLRATDDEKNVLEAELKKTIKENLTLEAELQKLKVTLGRLHSSKRICPFKNKRKEFVLNKH